MVLAMLLAISSIACSERKGDSYTFTCAKKYFEICDYDKALEYAQKEVAENPKNGAAHAIIGSVYVFRGESVKALTALDKALSNLSEKDKKERAHAFVLPQCCAFLYERYIGCAGRFEKVVRVCTGQ